MTEWLQRQLDAIKADAKTWSAWKRREVGLMPKPAPPVIRRFSILTGKPLHC